MELEDTTRCSEECEVQLGKQWSKAIVMVTASSSDTKINWFKTESED